MMGEGAALALLSLSFRLSSLASFFLSSSGIFEDEDEDEGGTNTSLLAAFGNAEIVGLKW